MHPYCHAFKDPQVISTMLMSDIRQNLCVSYRELADALNLLADLCDTAVMHIAFDSFVSELLASQ